MGQRKHLTPTPLQEHAEPSGTRQSGRTSYVIHASAENWNSQNFVFI